MTPISTVLDLPPTISWDLDDAYVSTSQSLVLILGESGVEMPRQAFVTFEGALDYQFSAQPPEARLSTKLEVVQVPDRDVLFFRLYVGDRLVEVVGPSKPTILIKAPFSWLEKHSPAVMVPERLCE